MPTRNMLSNEVHVVFDFVARCIVLLHLPLSSPHSSLMKQGIALWQEMVLQYIMVFLSCYTSICCSTCPCVWTGLLVSASDELEGCDPPQCDPHVHMYCNGVALSASCASGAWCAPSSSRFTFGIQLKVFAVCEHDLAP